MKFSNLVSAPVVNYVRDISLREGDVQRRLREETEERTGGRSVMISSPEQQQLIQLLLKLYGAKKCIEVGVFTGYSALCVALAIPDDGKIVALDVSEEWTSIGKPYWKEAGVEHKVDLRIAPATETLAELIKTEAGTYDYAFIDADKSNYDTYYESCLKLVRKGGLIALDNMFRGGNVLDESIVDEDTVTIRNLNKKIKNDDRVDIAVATIADGVTFVRVK
jgi:caffeoyl-CoA O-methyltransferase